MKNEEKKCEKEKKLLIKENRTMSDNAYYVQYISYVYTVNK